tara:strand:+ start:1041 stop:1766 length:726 start_codon:yes stop_codon:yes gene_type:complete
MEKNKVYLLRSANTPPLVTVQSKHTRRKPLLWFDKEKGHQRELRYATNQQSPFVDEQKGVCTLGHISFRQGRLVVPGTKPNLVKFLEHHPLNGTLFFEYEPVKIAEDQTDAIELEFKALSLAKKLEIDELEAVMRVELGSKIRKMSSKEIKRDALMFAKRKPAAFIALAADDNVQLRNIGIKAVEANIIKLSNDNRKFTWASNGRKLFTVPFEEHPYSALAAWLKTDEGLEVLQALEKKLK